MLTLEETVILSLSIKRWRNALTDISWFMRCTKESLARLSNQEDGCKGRFWEGRFHSQALLDTQALIACMTYVDLNPMRAKMGEYPESDPFTSLHLRAEALSRHSASPHELPTGLLSIDAYDDNTSTSAFPVNTVDYLELVDLAARYERPGKSGALHNSTRPVLERLGISSSSWQELELRFRRHFHVLVGCSDSLRNACRALGQERAWGQRHCQNFFNEPIVR